MTNNSKQSHKISDNQFTEIFIENNGSYAKTAKAIEQRCGISYSRQAVFERAKSFIDLERDLIIQNAQTTEEQVNDYAADETLDKTFRARLAEKKAERHARYRLQLMRIEAKKEQQQKKDEPKGYFEIDGKEFNF